MWGKKIYGKSFGGVACSTLAKYASVPKRHMINGSGQVAPHQQVFTTFLFPPFYPCVTLYKNLVRAWPISTFKISEELAETAWLTPFITSLYMTLATGTELPINTHAHILPTPCSCLQGHVKLDLTHFRCLMSFSECLQGMWGLVQSIMSLSFSLVTTRSPHNNNSPR